MIFLLQFSSFTLWLFIEVYLLKSVIFHGYPDQFGSKFIHFAKAHNPHPSGREFRGCMRHAPWPCLTPKEPPIHIYIYIVDIYIYIYCIYTYIYIFTHIYIYTLWLCQNSYWKWPFIDGLPITNGGSFQFAMLVYQRVYTQPWLKNEDLSPWWDGLFGGKIFWDSPADVFGYPGLHEEKREMENWRRTKQHDLQMLGVPYLC